MKAGYDAIVVGSGPNGLSAAITIAERGGRVLLLEAGETVGGGMRTSELTLPGFEHDVCSAVHPLGVSSPFFRKLPLALHGLEWVFPPAECAHPLDRGDCVLLHRSIDETAEGLAEDGNAYRKLMKPLVTMGDTLLEEVLQAPLHLPSTALGLKGLSAFVKFGLDALKPASSIARSRFRNPRTQALFAGLAAHAMIPLSHRGSSATALVLAMAAHLRGWPFPKGGAGRLAHALTSYFLSLGGEVQTGFRVSSLDQLPDSKWVFLDVSPRQFSEMAVARLSESQKKNLARFEYGAGVYKIDFALSQPIPWSSSKSLKAATVHLGGTLSEVEASEEGPNRGKVIRKPFVLVTQPSLFDSERAPPGSHTAWAYCHVPNGSPENQNEAIENQIERFAPGFLSTILARKAMGPSDFENYNPNYVGGDISSGLMSLKQVLFRSGATVKPYSTPISNVFLCSASTPPGPGVHGMCGHLAALSVIDKI
jgi:phytoene dehydrogenase-like protein